MPRAMNTSPTTIEIGRRMYSTQRVRSTQKLPSVRAERRAKPRISTIASTMPVAAETKLCTVSAHIWVR